MLLIFTLLDAEDASVSKTGKVHTLMRHIIVGDIYDKHTKKYIAWSGYTCCGKKLGWEKQWGPSRGDGETVRVKGSGMPVS